MHMPMHSLRKFLNEKKYFTLLNTSMSCFCRMHLCTETFAKYMANVLNSDVSLGAVKIQHNNYIYIFVSIYAFVPAVC